ncbi:MAG: hypothetical protein PVH59_08395, partial [Anaerolineae bacterium]
MRRTTRFLRFCAERVLLVVVFLLVGLVVTGCVSPDEVVPVPATSTPIALLPTETPRPTSTPVPTAMDFPMSAPTHEAAAQQGYETCVQCHADEAMLKDSMASGEGIVSQSEDEAWAGELPPEERWQAVYLDDLAFLESIHGRYGCITCHGGM